MTAINFGDAPGAMVLIENAGGIGNDERAADATGQRLRALALA